MDERMRGWMWTHPGDEKYCNALPLEHSDSDTGEPYIDSLHQLNKIVERIMPEKSPLSLVSVRPKLGVPASLKRSFVDHKELPSRKPTSVSSSLAEIPIDSPTKHPPLSMMPSVCLEDSLRLKALRPSDSLNDSAYETYCGDASNDALDSVEKNIRVDELSSGNDPSDFCVSPSGRKSEDISKTLFYGKGKDFGVIGSTLIKDAGGDMVVGDNLVSDVDCKRTRRKSLESAISVATIREYNKQSEQLQSKDSSIRGAGGLSSSKCQNGSYRNNVLGSSEFSAAGKLPELERYVADSKCWSGVSHSNHISSSLDAAKLGSSLSSNEGSLVVDSDHLSGHRIRNVREGINTGDEGEDEKLFSCPHCAYTASKKGQVRKHLSVHGIFLCAHCEFACERADLLEEHRHIRHPGLCGRRLCKKCRVLFQSSELEAHERQCSGEKQRWACRTCGKEFKFLSVMKAHANKWHPPVDDIISAKPVDTVSDTASSKPCSVSSGTPSVTYSTQPDSVISTEVKQFQCSECGKMFKTKWTLSNHVLSHAGADTPFCCDVDGCSGVTFRSDKELNCHRMAVHRLGPTKYQCSHPGCTMQFAKYGHFKRHQLTHTAAAESDVSSGDVSERRFVCDWTQCGKAFSHPDNLRVHYRRHTDEKPHHCHHCEAAYRQKSGLKYHLEKVHGEKTVSRCGRKRKVSVENSSHQIPASGSFILSKSGEVHSKVENKSEQTFLSNNQTMDSNITVSIKHTSLSKVHEVNMNVSDLQTKELSKSDVDSDGKGRRLSFPESLSPDCDDNLDNIDINDEWLLNEDDGFISRHRKLSDTGVTRNVEKGDREQAGSTSDTEPLDDDICEELRKLSDAINSDVLSPHGLDSMSSPFELPVGTAYGPPKSDHATGVLPDMSSPHSRLFCREEPTAFDHFSSTSLPQDSNVTSDFYRRNPEVSTSSMSTHGLCSCNTSTDAEIVNGYLPDAYRCTDVPATHFERNASASESTHLPVDRPEIDEPTSYHSASFEDTVRRWPVPVNSPRWSSHSNENPTFMPLPAHGSSASVCSSAETGFSDQVCREDGTYSNLMSSWSAAEQSQRWMGNEGIFPNWSQRHLGSVTGHRDITRQYDWHMGQHAESAFTQRGTSFESRTSFETSPKPCMPYRTDMREAAPMSDHLIDKHGGIYPASGIGHTGSWSDLYARSPHMTGIGNYEYSLPRSVYRSPVPSDNFYSTSGYSGIQSHSGYERLVKPEGSYGISNSPYRIPVDHMPSWPMPGLPNAPEPLRSMPDAQPSSVLYNVVPRYY